MRYHPGVLSEIGVDRDTESFCRLFSCLASFMPGSVLHTPNIGHGVCQALTGAK